MTDTAARNLRFISPPISIDFIAYHDLQAQAGFSVFEAMENYFNCRWLIGPNQKPTGAEAAVFLDHVSYHPALKKSPGGYRYLFHMSHDLGDIAVYKNEKRKLKTFDIIFVPSRKHFLSARKALGRDVLILETGWGKYDRMDFPEKYLDLKNKIEGFPYKRTIIYVPTHAGTYEWKYLFPLFKDLPCNFIIKNHIYVNKGQAFPDNQEEEYRQQLASVCEMEKAILEYNAPNMIVAPREMNVCALFKFADLVISDQSSILIEFLPFGLSVETGRHNNMEDCIPECSRWEKEVLFLNRAKLCSTFSSLEKVERLLLFHKQKKHKPANKTMFYGEMTALLIDRYFFEIKNKPNIFLRCGKKNILPESILRLIETVYLNLKMTAWRKKLASYAVSEAQCG